jgi:hypothetical protein
MEAESLLGGAGSSASIQQVASLFATLLQSTPIVYPELLIAHENKA